MGKLILIASGKGGVGKSTISANLGAALGESGYRVALVDMNIGLRNLDIYMGLESKVVFDVTDILDGIVPLEKALVRDKRFPATYLLATTQSKEKFSYAECQIEELYDDLRNKFDYIIVDGPAGINNELRMASISADIAVIVTTPEYVSLRDADMADRMLDVRGISKRACIVNKVNRALIQTGFLPSMEQVKNTLRIPLVGIVQYDNALHLSANAGHPIVLQKGNYIERNFRNIAERIIAF